MINKTQNPAVSKKVGYLLYFFNKKVQRGTLLSWASGISSYNFHLLMSFSAVGFVEPFCDAVKENCFIIGACLPDKLKKISIKPKFSFVHSLKHLPAHDCWMVLMYHVPVHLSHVPALLARKDIAHKCFLQNNIAGVFLIFKNLTDCLPAPPLPTGRRGDMLIIQPIRYLIQAPT